MWFADSTAVGADSLVYGADGSAPSVADSDSQTAAIQSFLAAYNAAPRADVRIPVEQMRFALLAFAYAEGQPLHLDLYGDCVAQSQAILTDYAANPQPSGAAVIQGIFEQAQALAALARFY